MQEDPLKHFDERQTITPDILEAFGDYITIRTARALAAAGVWGPGDLPILESMTEAEIRRRPNCGARTVKQIRELMSERGLSFAKETFNGPSGLNMMSDEGLLDLRERTNNQRLKLEHRLSCVDAEISSRRL